MKQNGWIIFIAVCVGVLLLSAIGVLQLGQKDDGGTTDNSSAYYEVYNA